MILIEPSLTLGLPQHQHLNPLYVNCCLWSESCSLVLLSVEFSSITPQLYWSTCLRDKAAEDWG